MSILTCPVIPRGLSPTCPPSRPDCPHCCQLLLSLHSGLEGIGYFFDSVLLPSASAIATTLVWLLGASWMECGCCGFAGQLRARAPWVATCGLRFLSYSCMCVGQVVATNGVHMCMHVGRSVAAEFASSVAVCVW